MACNVYEELYAIHFEEDLEHNCDKNGCPGAKAAWAFGRLGHSVRWLSVEQRERVKCIGGLCVNGGASSACNTSNSSVSSVDVLQVRGLSSSDTNHST